MLISFLVVVALALIAGIAALIVRLTKLSVVTMAATRTPTQVETFPVRPNEFEDSALQARVLRSSIAELLRTARTYRAFLEQHVSELSRRGIADSREAALVQRCRQAIDDALGLYADDAIQSLLYTTRHLYNLVALHMLLNLRVRRGDWNDLSRHLGAELNERESFPWSMAAPTLADRGNGQETTVELLDLVPRTCEQLSSMHGWLNRQRDADTESAFVVLVSARDSLAKIEGIAASAGR